MKTKTWAGCSFVTLAIAFLSIFSNLSGAAENAAADGPKLNLSGTVTAETGDPIQDATVFIYTAGPREGIGILCPSCYVDCQKKATTDADGRFTIEDLDATLLFRILVVAKGRQPEFVSKVDPATGPLTVTLKPVSPGEAPEQRLIGRVIDQGGEPLEDAVVRIKGVTRNRSTSYGGNQEIDPVAVTDASGEFVLHAKKPFDSAGLEVEARGLAKGIFRALASGERVHELKLTEGVSVEGRVVKDGKPLAGVGIGISGANRSSEVYVGNFSVATDEEGYFLFVNLPAQTDYVIYGIMNSLGERGAISARRIKTQEDGSTLDVGDLAVGPGYVVAGQIRLADGKPVPKKTRLHLGREKAWDSLQTEADEEGRFRFTGVPAEAISLSARIKGYRMSARNFSLDPLNPMMLIGTIQTNKTDLVLEFEAGKTHQRLSGDQLAIREEPLRGVESVQVQEGDIKVNGTVVDDESGSPIKAFSLIEGRQSQFGRDFDWFENRATQHEGGAFSVYLTKQRRSPAILIEADGYLPHASGAITTTETNLHVRLKKGSALQGTVRKPDGSVADGVTVYLADMRNGVYFSGEPPKVRDDIYKGTEQVKTDEEGRFSFKPKIDAYAFIIADDAGYAEVLVRDASQKFDIQLQPWARIEGRLLIGNRPGAREQVKLWLNHIPYAHEPRSFPPLSLHLDTTTDNDGRFVFDRVPPIKVQVYHSPNVRDSKTGTIPMSQTTSLVLEPGETRTLTVGGVGRPVIGRFTVDEYEGTIDWRSDVQSLETLVPEPPGLPDLRALSKEFSEAMRNAKTDEEKAAASEAHQQRRAEAIEQMKAFYKTEAGLQYDFAKRRFALNFGQDGSFRVEDVPGGKYTLKIALREPAKDGSSFSSPVIATLEKTIEIPEAPGGRTDEVFDLGIMPLTARKVMKVGKAAPDFEVATLDGGKVKLSDFRGKYVLLDFWAVWCGPCVAETPNLKATWEAFKHDPRFAFIALSLDPDASTARKYVEKNELKWTQAWLGEWSKTDLPAKYGVEGIPAILLVDPEGKIAATGLRGSSIESTVRAALNKKE